MPKVSVIIPVYGVEKFIERCARSLFEQTLDDIEYLFIDDSTPDRSIDVLLGVLENYPNRQSQVRLYKMEVNSGQAKVRSYALNLMTGEFFLFVDSDDWLAKDALEKLYIKAQEDICDCVTFDYMETDANHICKLYSGKVDGNLLDSLINGNTNGSLFNKFYKRQTYVASTFIPPVGNMGEDFVINLQLAYNVKTIGYIKQHLYFYYINKTSICHKPGCDAILGKFYQSISNVSIIILFAKQNHIYNKYKDSIAAIAIAKRHWLAPLLKQDNIYKIWKNTYPEFVWPFLKSKISIKYKILFLFNYFKIDLYGYLMSRRFV